MNTRKVQPFVNMAMPVAVVAVLLIFIAAITSFVWQNSHFIGDDIWNFEYISKQSLINYILSPIDVHFVPLHKLASFLIYMISPLDFRVALVFMVACWLGVIIITHRVLIRLTSKQAAWIITLMLGASPLLIHNLIWWSSAMHRLPNLLLQAAVFLFYLRYRERENGRDAFLCVAMQICAFGFIETALLYPLMLASFEMCLAFMERRVSKAGLKLCMMMAAISMIYLAWYLMFAPGIRPSHPIRIIDLLILVFYYHLHLGSLLLFLPIGQLWAAYVSGAIWLGAASFCIWRRPGNIVPIAVLLVLLSISFVMLLIGRGSIATPGPGTMRHHIDQLVILAIFAGLIISRYPVHSRVSPGTPWYGAASILLAVFIVAYPMASYQTSRALFARFYIANKQTHDFMSDMRQSLQELSVAQPHATIAARTFPDFAASHEHTQIENVFGPLYPELKWVKPEGIRERMLYICDDGSLVPSDQQGQSPCAGRAIKTELFVHQSPDFTVTVPKYCSEPDDIRSPTIVMNKESGSTRFIADVADLSKYPAGTTLKDTPKLFCLFLQQMFKVNVNCQTLYGREIKLNDGTPAYEYEVHWGISPDFANTYRVSAFKDKKLISVGVNDTKAIRDDLKQFPRSLTFQQERGSKGFK